MSEQAQVQLIVDEAQVIAELLGMQGQPIQAAKIASLILLARVLWQRLQPQAATQEVPAADASI